MKLKTFILSTGSVNSYGFRLLTSGVELERFEANPIMFYNHKRGVDSDKLPIGKWVNIRIEDDKLLADAEFDLDDKFAAKIAAKVEKGVLKAASVGFDPIEVSSDPEDMVAGQTLPTVTSWSIFEASVVDLPSNGDALALMYEGEVVVLDKSFDFSKLSFLSKDTNPTQTNPKIDKMKYPKELLSLLGLGADATDIEVLTAVQALNKRMTEAEAAKTTAEEGLADALSKDAVAKIEAQSVVLKLDATQKDGLLKLAKSGQSELALQTLGMMTPRETLTDLGKGAGAGGDGNAGTPKADSELTYGELSKTNPKALEALSKDDPEKFKELKDAHILSIRGNRTIAEG